MKNILNPIPFLLLFLVPLTSLSQVSWADSCVASTFYLRINNTGNGHSRIHRVHQYAGGDLIAVGEIAQSRNGTGKVYALVMRISSLGQLKWSRFIGYDSA